MKTSKKKTIIISSIIAVVLVSALAILIFNNIKKERELQEAIKLIEQQEKEARELKQQQEQEEKERQEQERLARLEEGWNALAENQEYLALGSDHLKRTIEKQGNTTLTTFTYTEEFIGSLYMIQDGWFVGINNQELVDALTEALAHIEGDTATGKEVYDALCDYISVVNRDAVISGTGEAPFSETTNNTISQKDNQNQSSNNQSSNKNNNQSSNKNNNSNNTPPSDSGEDESGGTGQTSGWGNAEGWTNGGDWSADDVIHDPDDGSGWELP